MVLESRLSPLTRAIYQGRGEEVISLLSSGEDINAHDGNGHTPLTMVAQRNNTSILPSLLDAGADITICRTRGRTPLHCAIGTREDHEVVVMVAALLRVGADVDAVDDYGKTTLMFAVHANYTIVAQTLLNAGAGVNIPCYRGRTALHRAALNADVDMVVLLLSREADMNAVDEDGATPIISAASSYEENAGLTAQTLFESGAVVTISALNGRTALHYAALRGLDEIVIPLLSGGVDKDKVDVDGNTPLILAIEPGKGSTVQTLLEGGSNPNTRHRDGSSPLHYAVGEQKILGGLHMDPEDEVDEAVVRLLLRAGADPTAKDGGGATPADLIIDDPNGGPILLLLDRASAWHLRILLVMLRNRDGVIGGGAEGGNLDLSGAVEFLRVVPEGVFRVAVSFL